MIYFGTVIVERERSFIIIDSECGCDLSICDLSFFFPINSFHVELIPNNVYEWIVVGSSVVLLMLIAKNVFIIVSELSFFIVSFFLEHNRCE